MKMRKFKNNLTKLKFQTDCKISFLNKGKSPINYTQKLALRKTDKTRQNFFSPKAKVRSPLINFPMIYNNSITRKNKDSKQKRPNKRNEIYKLKGRAVSKNITLNWDQNIFEQKAHDSSIFTLFSNTSTVEEGKQLGNIGSKFIYNLLLLMIVIILYVEY